VSSYAGAARSREVGAPNRRERSDVRDTACVMDGIALAGSRGMKASRRKLTLLTETLRTLTADELARIDGGAVSVRDTQQNSCHGISCDASCAGMCVTQPR